MATASIRPVVRAPAKLIVLLLGALVLLNYVDRGAIGIAAPRLKDELGLTPAEFGLAVSAFAWIYAPAQFAVGWLSDRFCVYRLIAIGLAVWSLATFVTGLATGLATLVTLRLLLGIGEGVAFPAASKIIARHVVAERRGIANSVPAAALAFGPALGTFAGGLILRYSGWRPIFFVFGAASLLWLLPWFLASKREWRTRSQRPESGVGLAEVMRQPIVWSMGIGHFMNTYGFYFLLAWLPLFLVKERGFSLLEMTGMMTVTYIVQGVGALAWGWISDRLVRSGREEGQLRKGLMSLNMFVSAAAILCIGYSVSPGAIFGWLVVNAIFSGIGGSNSYAIAQIYAGPDAAGRWVGVMNGVGNISGIIGPILTGVLIEDSGSYMSAFVASAAIVGCGTLWWWFALPRVRPLSFIRVSPAPLLA